MSTAGVLARTGRAEWSRVWSVRSSWVFALVTALAVVGLATIIGLDVARDRTAVPAGETAWDGIRATEMFALFGVLALAVVTATADHATGGIVPTLQWTPRRGVLLAARTGVLVASTTVLALVLVLAAGIVVRLLAPEAGLPAGQGAEVLGGLALVYGTSALLAVGLALALRSTAGALVLVIALVLVLPVLLGNLPYDWAVETSARLPGSNVILLIFGEAPLPEMTPTSARVTLVVWALAALAAGTWRLLRSDADR